MGIKNMFTQYRGLPKEIYVLFFNRLINSAGAFVFPFLTLFLNEKVGLPADKVGEFLLVLAVVGLPGSIIAGKLVDKYNRKGIMITVNYIGAVILIICGFLGNSMLIPYLLILQCFLFSFSFPASNAITSDLTTPENRQRCFSFLYLGMNVGFAIGYSLAGFLFQNYTSWLFWGDGLTMILATTLVLIFVKETKPTEEEMNALNETDRIHERMERGSAFSVLLKRPYVLAFTIISAMISFVYSQHGFLMPLHLKGMFGVDSGAKFFGSIMALNTIVVVICTPILGSLTGKNKPITNVAIGAFTYVVGFGCLYFAKSVEVFFMSVFIWTLGEVIIMINSGVYISNHSPISHRGRFNSILGIIRSSGRSLAPYLMGMYLIGHNYSDGWMITGSVAFVAMISLLVLKYVEDINKKKDSIEETTKTAVS